LVAADRASGGQKEARGGRATSRLFQTKMMRVCGFLSALLEEVYQAIYKEEAKFNLLAMPRLEIAGMEDLKILHEIGVLQPEHTVDLSEVLLGKMKKKPKTAMQPAQPGAKDKKKDTKDATSTEDKKQSFL
jgi:DNA-directed RNA polymerase beta subunit